MFVGLVKDLQRGRRFNAENNAWIRLLPHVGVKFISRDSLYL